MDVAIGKTNISNEVLSKIAGVAAMECCGVVGMSPRNIKDGIAELLRRENINKGIEVNIENDIVNFDLYIIVAYGIRISEVAQIIQETVKFNVENMSGLKVGQINIHVQGVRVDADEQ